MCAQFCGGERWGGQPEEHHRGQGQSAIAAAAAHFRCAILMLFGHCKPDFKQSSTSGSQALRESFSSAEELLVRQMKAFLRGSDPCLPLFWRVIQFQNFPA
eukprot:1157958-Pelagomonas_calceolata.AAC.7